MRILEIASLVMMSNLAIANTVTLTEESVVKLALERNEKVGISSAEIEKAEGSLSKAYSELFPVISASATLSKSSSTGSAAPNGDDWSEGANLQLNQPVFTFGKISSGIDMAKSLKAIKENSQVATVAEVKQMAKKLYYAVMYNDEIVKISSDSYNNALENKKTLEQRVSAGRISRNDNLKMLADLASRKPQLVEAQNSLAASRLQLANFLAIETAEDIKIASNLEKIPAVTKEEVNKDSINKLANIKMLEENLKFTKSSISLAQAQQLPTLSAFASYAPTTYRSEWADEPVREQETAKFGLMLTFDWSIGGAKNQDVAIKKIENKIAKLQYDSGKREIETNFKILTKRYDSLLEKMNAEVAAVKLAQASYKVALSAYSTGAVSQLQLNDSELLLTRNKMSLAATRYSIFTTIADLERLLVKGKNGDDV